MRYSISLSPCPLRTRWLIFAMVMFSGLLHHAIAQVPVFERHYPSPPAWYCHEDNGGNYGYDGVFYPDHSTLLLTHLVVGGDTCAAAANGADAIQLIRLNRFGDTLWIRFHMHPLTGIESPAILWGYSICPAHDGGFVIAGEYEPGTLSLVTAFMMKIDTAGEMIWWQEYKQDFLTRTNKVQESADHGFLASGYTAGPFGADQVPFLLKTDSAGNVVWQHGYTGGYQGEFVGVAESPEGSITAFSRMIPEGSTQLYEKFCMVNIDPSTGQEMTRHYIGDPVKSQVFADGVPLGDGKLLLIGGESVPEVDQLCLVKCDPAGNTDWYRTFGDTLHEYHPESVMLTPDSGFVVAGWVKLCHTDPNHPGWLTCDTTKCFFSKHDKEGNQTWLNQWGRTGDWSDALFSLRSDSDHSSLAVGYSDYDVYVIRYDSGAFTAPVGIGNPGGHAGRAAARLYPNPCSGAFIAELSSDCGASDPVLLLCNDLGRELLRAPLQPGINRIDRENLPDGLYFWRIVSGNRLLGSGKLMMTGN